MWSVATIWTARSWNLSSDWLAAASELSKLPVFPELGLTGHEMSQPFTHPEMHITPWEKREMSKNS
jgi:hypothetical protein